MRIFKQRDWFLLLTCGKKKLFDLSHVMMMSVMLLASIHAYADDVVINESTFPDPAFRTFVDSIAGKTGILKQSTINSITTFGNGLKGKKIKDLTGLKYFTNLTKLYCQDNPGLTTIDLSGNENLQELNITGCKVTSLDFTHNPNMTNINCADMATLTSINVSKCSNLKYLFVANNLLTTLDVTNNTKLIQLSFYTNQLSSIDLSKNTALQQLWAFGNPNLTSLDLTNNTKLTYLSVYGNNMPTLDVSMLTQLQTLLCFNNKLKELDLSGNTALTGLSCYSNSLTTLDLTNNTQLTHLDCHSNKLTSLIIHPTSVSQMKFISVSNNALAFIDLSSYTNLKENYDTNLFKGAAVGNQKRRMMLYTDGTDAYMKVEEGIDASKISDAKLNLSGATTPITFTVGTAANGWVPLKFSNGAVRTRLFNWASSTGKPSITTITYNYNTGSSLSNLDVMDVTDSVECYLLPMSQEYGTVNLPYDVVLPTGATAYAVSSTQVTPGSYDNKAYLTEIASEGEIVAANTPMLIRRSDDTYTLFALNQSTGTAKSAASNLLKGTQNSAITNKDNYYVLGIESKASSVNYEKLGFWRSTNSKIGTWRAYLDLEGTSTSSAKGFVLSLDFPTTGISDIRTSDNNADSPWYTIDGRALDTMPSQRGIYIHHGKKIVISK